MGESVKSGGRLEVSVSFGRFENDSLSWEKWSSFSPNKYLEEVENISTPGSVAQKKAYFEAHYKKIAARKAEQLERERPMESGSFSPDNPIGEDHAETLSSSDAESGFCNGDISAEEVEHETCATVLKSVTAFDEARDADDGPTEEIEQETGTTGLTNIITSEVAREDAAVVVKCGSSAVKEDEEEMNANKINLELNDGGVPILVKEASPQTDSRDTVEQLSEMEGGAEKGYVLKKEHSKLNARNQAQKVTPTKKGRNLIATEKIFVSSTVKSSQVSVSRLLITAPISTPMSAPRTLKNKVNETPQTKSKSTPLVKFKRAAPTALHMSLSLGPTNSSAAFASTRKSLIMEKMGDKDIVMRAFKTFHNHINGLKSPSDEKFSTSKKVSSMASERKVSTSLTPRKENEGPWKAAEKTVTPRAQAGTRLKSESSGLVKGSGLDRKNATPVMHSRGMRSDDRAEKRKEFLKKLEAKSIGREAENGQFSSKSKDEKEAEMKKLRQSLNFKATPLPSFYRVQGKGHFEKVSTDGKIHPRLASNR